LIQLGEADLAALARRRGLRGHRLDRVRPYRQAIPRAIADEDVAAALAGLANAAEVIEAPPETPVPGGAG
jgi:hypothetical protein